MTVSEKIRTYLEYILKTLRTKQYSNSNELVWVSLVIVHAKIKHDVFKEDPAFDPWPHIVNSSAVGQNIFSSNFLGIASSIDINREYDNWNLNQNLLLNPSYKEAISSAVLYLEDQKFDFPKQELSEIIKAYLAFIDDHIQSDFEYSLTNSKLRSLLALLVDPKPDESIYDPASGTGSIFAEIFLRFLKQYPESNFKIYSQEKVKLLTSLQWQVLYFLENKIIKNNDSILFPPTSGNDLVQFDKIVSDLPIGCPIYEYKRFINNDKYYRFEQGFPSRNSSEFLFILSSLSLLKKEGKAYFVVSEGILSRMGADYKIRRNLIEDDLIDSIISIPQHYSSNTKIKRCILVLRKQKDDNKKGKITFILDSEKYYNEDNASSSFIRSITEKMLSSKAASVVAIDEIQEKNYDLRPHLYNIQLQLLHHNKEQYGYKKLSEVVKIAKAASIINEPLLKDNIIKKYPLIRRIDLKRNIDEIKLENQNYTFKTEKGNVVNDKAILIGVNGNHLRPTLFDPSEIGPVALEKNIIALIPKGRTVDIMYLYYTLYSPEIKAQLDILRQGIIPYISRKDLLSILIKVPALEEQQKLVQEKMLGVIEFDKVIAEKETIHEKVIDATTETEERTISILAHNLLPDLYVMHEKLNSLEKFIKAKDLLELSINTDEEIDIELQTDEQGQEIVVRDVINYLRNGMTNFEETISEIRQVIQLKIEKADLTSVDFSEFLLGILNERKLLYKDKFTIIHNIQPNIILKIKEQSIIKVVDLLLNNAHQHAFDKSTNDPEVSFTLNELDNGEINLIYSNNGKQMNLSQDEFISFGKKGSSSKGHGLGGYYINKVVNAHGGSIQLLQQDKGMKLILKIDQINWGE